jgi:hypothetical protein
MEFAPEPHLAIRSLPHALASFDLAAAHGYSEISKKSILGFAGVLSQILCVDEAGLERR